MNILINGKPVDALAMIVHKLAAHSIGKAWVTKLSRSPFAAPARNTLC